ncbi:hypothetical protein D3C71_1824110 [compost metagenome]
MAPRTFDAVAFAKHVVQQHVSSARRVGAGVVADDAVEAEQRFDRCALEPAVQILGGGDGEQVQQFLLQARVQRLQLQAQLAGLPQFRQRAQPAAVRHVGRCL